LHNKLFINPSSILGVMERKIHFNDKDDGPSIEEYIKNIKSFSRIVWRIGIWVHLRDDARSQWHGINSKEIHALSDKKYEKLFLDKWSRAKSKNKECTKGLFSCGNSIL